MDDTTKELINLLYIPNVSDTVKIYILDIIQKLNNKENEKLDYLIEDQYDLYNKLDEIKLLINEYKDKVNYLISSTTSTTS